MRRYPHRIIFRMTGDDFDKFKSLLGRIYGVYNWSDLCRHGLGLAFQEHEGRILPLGSAPVRDNFIVADQEQPKNGHTTPAVSDKTEKKIDAFYDRMGLAAGTKRKSKTHRVKKKTLDKPKRGKVKSSRT